MVKLNLFQMTLSPDSRGQIDGSIQKHILNYLPPLPIDIVPISFFPNFQFKPPQTNRYCLIDFMEPHAPNEEYNNFWSWVIHNPPLLRFRRELNKDQVSRAIKPCEFPCYLDIPPVQTREQFDARPIDVLFYWGYSHVSRPLLHAKIFEGMATKGIDVLDTWDVKGLDISEGGHEKSHHWMSIHTPHWHRKPMTEIVPWMMKSKITAALYGNGRKTFRHGECVGTLMALPKDNLAWGYDWNETNSIQLDPERLFDDLLAATQRSDLYDLYLKCDANMRKYHAPTYARDYVAKEIEKVL